MGYPNQKMMEVNIMPGKSGLVSFNDKARDVLVKRTTTGDSGTNTKSGGKKSIDVNKKMKKVMRKVMK